MLVAIKHSVKITEGNRPIGKVLRSAWVDYNNSDIFTKDTDIVALVTGPLSVSDVDHTWPILKWAKTAENADEYMERMRKTRFSSDEKRNKLQAIRHHLEDANGTEPIDENDFFTFLKHWHIISSDLSVETSLNFSFLTAFLSVRSRSGPRELWSRMVEVIDFLNQTAGTVTFSSLEERLQGVLRLPEQRIPTSYVPKSVHAEQVERMQHEHVRHLSFASFLGMWDENNIKDRVLIEQLVDGNYTEWILGLMRFLNLPDSLVSLRDGRWSVKDRKQLWRVYGEHLRDDDLKVFQKCALEVLRQRDPAFDLLPSRRYAAKIYGKVPPHSDNLRKGITEGLALIGSHSEALKNCSRNRGEQTARSTVRELLNGANPEIWGSLDQLLPDLAEAAPAEFLKAVDMPEEDFSNLTDFLFAQEGRVVFERPCHTGLLRALEILAWDENYLSTSCALLGRLASLDPGGRLSPRPADLLITIFLPWFPQTIASFDKRKSALNVLTNEVPEEAWKLILGLLPDSHQSSDGTCKPSWRDTIPAEWTGKISDEDYWKQVVFYAECAVEMAGNDAKRLSELIRRLDKLPKETFENLLELLSSGATIELPEEERLEIWESLTAFARRHRKFSDADWALNSKILDDIESIVRRLKPQSVLHVHRNLFGRYETDHYDQKGNYSKQAENLEEKRRQSVREILDERGLSGVFDFAKAVDRPGRVGHSLGAIADAEVDAEILPSLLGSDNQPLSEFVCGYAWRRREVCGWEWLDGLDMSDWKPLQIAHLLRCLPFTSKTWNRASDCLEDVDSEYWKTVPAYHLEENEHYNIAVDKLNACGRHDAAVDCLSQIHREGRELDVSRTVQTLLDAALSKESIHGLEKYEVTRLIKALRDHPDATTEDLKRVEWEYIPWLDHYYKDTSPVTLETQLGADPSFFCEVIRLLYCSENDKRAQRQLGEEDSARASFAWHLLHNWRMSPGSQPDGTFSFDDFSRWLGQVKKACNKSGHLEVALIHVGQVLFYCPEDSDGTWINRQVARVLNGEDAKPMRRGFSMEVINSRGAHWVDPTGAPERELAEKYREKAEIIERDGLRRFSETLREVARKYEREAQRIVDEYNDENSQ